MQPLTCPIPGNINPLQSNGFLFDILKLPEAKFFCQEVTLPSVTAQPATQVTPLSTAFLPGDMLEYGELSISFLIDEGMTNYIALYNWMIGLGFPQSHTQYRDFIRSRTDKLNDTVQKAEVSEAILSILNSTNTPSKTIRFVDVFPTLIHPIMFKSVTTTTEYQIATASFRYTYYTFE